MEDIDHSRVRDSFYRCIEEDLHWLGLEWQSPVLRQSSRQTQYQEALDKLKALGVLYPCFCTRKDIENELRGILNAPHGPEGTHYPGTCLRRSESERIDRIHAGELPSWRLNTQALKNRLPTLYFNDHRHGKVTVKPGLLGDIILARKDIGTSYHIAVVLDDAYQHISHVTRGEDLLHSTHIHRVLQELLDLPCPEYIHHPLITDLQGTRLAKRNQAYSLAQSRDEGKDPRELTANLPSRSF